MRTFDDILFDLKIAWIHYQKADMCEESTFEALCEIRDLTEELSKYGF